MDEDFLKRLLATFRVEAEEHAVQIANGLIALEQGLAGDEQAATVEAVFREAHSLKGAARAVGLGDIERLCQALEGVFAGARRGELELEAAHFDVAHRAVDAVTAIVAAPAGTLGASADEVAALVDDLAAIERGEKPRSPDRPPGHEEAGGATKGARPAETPPAEATPSAEAPNDGGPPAPRETDAPPASRPSRDTVRLSIDKLDDLLSRSEELLAVKLTAARNREKVRELAELVAEWEKQWDVMHPLLRDLRRREEGAAGEDRRRRGASYPVRVLELGETVGERLRTLGAAVADLDRTAERDLSASSMMVENLLDEVKKLLMLPFSTVLEAFPKLVRDLSHDQGKEVDLKISGASVEIDRRIMEEMRVVFTHLLRNAIDHGIAAPAQRQECGKPPRGTIAIAVRGGEGNSVEITVSDDGEGIDPGKLRDACVREGTLSEAESVELDDDELLQLAFRSGVSTSPMITDISGRGLGLAIVREKVERLGGAVRLQSRAGAGTTFVVTLPLTLATFRGVLVAAADRQYVLPVAGVERVVRVKDDELRTVASRQTLVVDDATLPLARLSDLLEQPGHDEGPETHTVLVLAARDARIGCEVDEILGEQEVIIKGLRPPLVRVRNVAAATILGSGSVVPVLDVADLVRSAQRAGGRTRASGAGAGAPESSRRSVLVVEDSITSRLLLKNIFEAAGYVVRTAVDGLDGLAQLQIEPADVIVSDVDMPRMDGFDLTAAIRADARLAELPVVLVTSLGSPEDRARGVDVGASAYIVKSSFDQSDLLETLKRLV